MTHTRREIVPGQILDARRALYLPEQQLLAVADLHFGYAWTHRARGQLLPLPPEDDTLPRLRSLLADYRPRQLVILGDIVHGVTPGAAWKEALLGLLAALRSEVDLVLLGGNHDRQLAPFLDRPLLAELMAGPHRLLHGDAADESLAAQHLTTARESGGRVICGHEHPAIVIGDGVVHSARVPCFVVSEGLLVLPAFSAWAAGSNIRHGEYLSPYLRASTPKQAVAILAGKLLPVRL